MMINNWTKNNQLNIFGWYLLEEIKKNMCGCDVAIYILVVPYFP